MNSPLKVMTIFGTRPEAIKMAPLVQALRQQPDTQPIVTVTAQHREMLDQVLSLFSIEPDYDLNIMQAGQTLSDITSHALQGLDSVIKKAGPDLVLVHGDTTTTFAASIAAFYNEVVVGHVEAGLRTGDKRSPFPEEMNRQLADVVSDLYFAPTSNAGGHLRRENKPEDAIYITGNTVIDAMKTTIKQDYHHSVLERIGGDRLLLVTAHRRENLGEPMRHMFHAIKTLVQHHSDVQVVYPVHLNPKVREATEEILGEDPRIHLIEPLDVIDFHNFASRAYMILTDSGGVQEEAPSLGVPVLVLRDTTERPEGIRAGTLKLAGTREADIERMAEALLEDRMAYQRMARASNPYGDGHAAQRIVQVILARFGYRTQFPEPFSF